MDSIDTQNISSSDTEEFKKRHDAEEFLQGNQYKKQDNVS